MKKKKSSPKKATSIKEILKKSKYALSRIPDFFRIQNIDKILKVVSFVVSIAILLAFILIAVVLVLLDEIFMLVAVAVLILGLIVSLINLFILYGLGHILTQNDKIITSLNKED